MQILSTSLGLLAGSLLASSAVAVPQEWKAPASDAARVNPIDNNADSVRQGAEHFARVCTSCHGATGVGDGMLASMLRRKPKDLSKVAGAQSDGELFWKIRNGNEFMAAQAKHLSEEDTWRVVHFVRSLQAPEPGAHAWASFPGGAWVQIHSEHEMKQGGNTSNGSRKARLTVGPVKGAAMSLSIADEAGGIVQRTQLALPSVRSFPGVRGPGQSAYAIFPFASDPHQDPEIVQPERRNVQTSELAKEQLEVAGETRTARLLQRSWQTTIDGQPSEHLLKVWLVEGFELPARTIHEVDGELKSESRLESLHETVRIGAHELDCVLMVVRKPTERGLLEQRCWSSALVPGFQVKMEWEMYGEGFQLTGRELVTDFRATLSNPPGTRPALGFMPDYTSMEEGVLVGDVTSGGPAAKGGMLSGDLMIELNGEPIRDLQDYMDVISGLLIGDTVEVLVDREGKQLPLNILVGQRSAQ